MKVAIAGYGMEGEVNLKYWQKLGAEVVIFDEQAVPSYPLPAGVETVLGPDALQNISGFDLVVRTAGLAPRKITTASKLWSGTREFFDKCPAPIIGVTGTKGKGTTASFIHSILTAAGKKSWLVGNIGEPALSILDQVSPDDVVVYELSSFQLWDLEKSPQVAVVLMIEPDHLDVHKDMQEYVTAKAMIRKNQGSNDICIYHPTNDYSRQIALAGGSPETAHRYAIAEDGQVYVKENTFFVQDHPICSTDAVQLPGVHNLENACAAISAARVFTTDDAAIERGLRAFEGLPHRLKLVRMLDGVSFYVLQPRLAQRLRRFVRLMSPRFLSWVAPTKAQTLRISPSSYRTQM
jgi:UDP-N-acetylmuramoylalanine--D-glutamate ligase